MMGIRRIATLIDFKIGPFRFTLTRDKGELEPPPLGGEWITDSLADRKVQKAEGSA